MEENGIATVVIASNVFEDRLKAMSLPRLVLTNFPMGRPVGAPNDYKTQKAVVLGALELIEKADQGGAVINFEGKYRPV